MFDGLTNPLGREVWRTGSKEDDSPRSHGEEPVAREGERPDGRVRHLSDDGNRWRNESADLRA